LGIEIFGGFWPSITITAIHLKELLDAVYGKVGELDHGVLLGID
jgi:hypothetical protein